MRAETPMNIKANAPQFRAALSQMADLWSSQSTTLDVGAVAANIARFAGDYG